MQLRRIAYYFIALFGLAVNLVSLIVAGEFTPSVILHYRSEFSPFVIAVRLTVIFLFALVGYLLLRYDRLLTAHKQAAEQLVREKERAQNYLDIAGTMIAVVDPDEKITLINQRGCELLGYHQEELMGKNWFDTLVPEAIRGEVRAVFGKLMAGDVALAEHYENPLITKDNQQRLIEFHNTILTDSDGQIVGTLFSGNDITEQKQAEEALRESEERYRSLTNDVLDSSGVGIFILDADFKVVWINRALERYFGLDRDQIIGKDKRKLVRENIKSIFEDPDRFARTVFATYNDNTYVENFECHVLAGDGREERWLEHWSQPIRSGLYAGGRIEHYTDITDRKQAEEQLSLQKALLEAQAEASIDGILVVDQDGQIISYNERFVEMWHIPQEVMDSESDEIVLQYVRDQLADPDEFMARVQYLYEYKDETSRDEITLLDGRTFDRYSAPVRGPAGEYFGRVWYFRDMSESRRLWDELNHQLVRDPLTGVYNRRYFNETILQEIKRADRYGHHVSFIMGDIDDLKAVNDNCGHLVGDQILQGTAHALQQASRAADIVIRYGGDEFLVIMPETNADQARAAVERFQQAFSEWLDQQVQAGTISPDLASSVGLSMGVACYEPGTDVAVEEVLAQADAAMYRAKRAKRTQRATA